MVIMVIMAIMAIMINFAVGETITERLSDSEAMTISREGGSNIMYFPTPFAFGLCCHTCFQDASNFSPGATFFVAILKTMPPLI